MNINIEQVTFKDLKEVAYGTGTFSLYSEKAKKATVRFSVQTDRIDLKGFIELDEKEYFENVSKLKELIKNKLSNSL